MRRPMLLAIALLLLLIMPGIVQRELTVPRYHTDLIAKRIFAYRGWQSTGVRIDQRDLVEIEAQGEWLYTPDEYHGPEGHAVFFAPSFYPFPHAAGGVLIGRIGETGRPFVVGKGADLIAREPGILYLRINDDILSDNDGWVAAQVDVTKTEESID